MNTFCGDHWNKLGLSQRPEIVKGCGWTTRSGNMSKTGMRILESNWGNLTPAAKIVISRFLQNEAHSSFIHHDNHCTTCCSTSRWARRWWEHLCNDGQVLWRQQQMMYGHSI